MDKRTYSVILSPLKVSPMNNLKKLKAAISPKNENNENAMECEDYAGFFSDGDDEDCFQQVSWL